MRLVICSIVVVRLASSGSRTPPHSGRRPQALAIYRPTRRPRGTSTPSARPIVRRNGSRAARPGTQWREPQDDGDLPGDGRRRGRSTAQLDRALAHDGANPGGDLASGWAPAHRCPEALAEHIRKIPESGGPADVVMWLPGHISAITRWPGWSPASRVGRVSSSRSPTGANPGSAWFRKRLEPPSWRPDRERLVELRSRADSSRLSRQCGPLADAEFQASCIPRRSVQFSRR